MATQGEGEGVDRFGQVLEHTLERPPRIRVAVDEDNRDPVRGSLFGECDLDVAGKPDQTFDGAHSPCTIAWVNGAGSPCLLNGSHLGSRAGDSNPDQRLRGPWSRRATPTVVSNSVCLDAGGAAAPTLAPATGRTPARDCGPGASCPFRLRAVVPHPPLMTPLIATPAAFALLRPNPHVHVATRGFAWLSRAEKKLREPIRRLSRTHGVQAFNAKIESARAAAGGQAARRASMCTCGGVRSLCGGVRSVCRKKIFPVASGLPLLPRCSPWPPSFKSRGGAMFAVGEAASSRARY